MITPADIRAAEAALDPPDPEPPPRIVQCMSCRLYFTRTGDTINYVNTPTDPKLLRDMSHGVCLECSERIERQGIK